MTHYPIFVWWQFWKRVRHTASKPVDTESACVAIPPARPLLIVIGPDAAADGSMFSDLRAAAGCSADAFEVQMANAPAELHLSPGEVPRAVLLRCVAWEPRYGRMGDPHALEHFSALNRHISLRVDGDTGEARGNPSWTLLVDVSKNRVVIHVTWDRVETVDCMDLIRQLEGRISALSPGVDELKPLIEELVKLGLSRQTPRGFGLGFGFLASGRAECERIGREIFALAGHSGMVLACETAGKQLGGSAQREIEVAWDGIGDWQG